MINLGWFFLEGRGSNFVELNFFVFINVELKYGVELDSDEDVIERFDVSFYEEEL